MEAWGAIDDRLVMVGVYAGVAVDAGTDVRAAYGRSADAAADDATMAASVDDATVAASVDDAAVAASVDDAAVGRAATSEACAY